MRGLLINTMAEIVATRCPSQTRYLSSPTHPRLIGFETLQNLQHVHTPLQQVCCLYFFFFFGGLSGRLAAGNVRSRETYQFCPP